MKRSQKPRVSWLPGPMLCQVKMFRTEDCPAKVASQPQRHKYPIHSSSKPQAPDLPPGFEGNHYADKPNVSNISRIKWKQPPKFLVNDSWVIGDGGESTERRTQNMRISKFLEAIYPHRSAIPSRPSVSPAVEAERFDDRKTPTIRLTPIEDECESAEELSLTSLESSFNTNKQDHLETKLPCSNKEPVSGLPPNLNLVAYAALTALMKTKEQGSMVDPDLLIKFLSNPEMLKNLINDTTSISSETRTQPGDTNTNPTRPVRQHVTSSPMVITKPQPIIIPQEQSFAASQPFTNPGQSSPPMPRNGNGNISLEPINGNSLSIPMTVHSSTSIAKQQPLPPRVPSSNSLPMNINFQRPQLNFSEPKVIVKPQPQFQHNFAFRTSDMNNVQASIGFGKGPQTCFDSYSMNLNRVDATSRPKPVVQPMKNVDYFKNLIREHGTVNLGTNQYNSQHGNGKFNGGVDQLKVQKQCIYHGTARGCKLGDSCIYIHDRLRTNFEAEAPMAKRLKFGRYEQNGL